METIGEDGRSIEECAGRDQALGQGRVGVRQPTLGPRPRRVGTGPTDHVGSIGEQAAGPAVSCVDGQDLGCAERGERHRSRRARPLLEPAIEARRRALSHPVLGGPSDRGPERPHGAAPAILDDPPSAPATASRSPVANPAVDSLRVRQEAVRHAGETDDDTVGDRRPAGRDQHPGHVVGAVPRGDARQRVLGVFERADAVAHRDDVGEAWLGSDHAVTPAPSSDVASSS